MQPTLQKVRSVDCGPGSQRTQLAGARQLVHSVSIVVELAKDPPRGRRALAASAPGDEKAAASPGEMDSADAGPGTSQEGEEEEEEEATLVEEDDEAEAEACLSSDLARKVVIVDEADKILMSRAQSAEPSVAPSALNRDAGQPLQQSGAAQGEDATSKVSGAPGGQSLPNIGSAGKQSSWFSTCSGGELAERGELRQLSRRRNTHHSIGAPATTYLQTQETSTATQEPPRASAQLASGGSKFAVAAPQQQHNRYTSGQPTQQLQAAAPNWSHRRQSLQMSLFAGSCRSNASCSVSKSLTEEELRGEREFNEQVRSARSPEVLGASPSRAPPTALANTSAGSASSQLRCRSVAGGSARSGVGSLSPIPIASASSSAGNSPALGSSRAVSGAAVWCVPEPSAPSNSDSGNASARKGSYQIPQSIVKSQSHKQAQQPRRVSFGSIDPIPSRIENHQLQHNSASSRHILQDPFQSQQQAPKHSLLNFKLSPRQQRLSSGSILENVSLQATTHPPPHSSNQSSSRPTHLGPSEPQSARHKRHSIATHTLVERIDQARQTLQGLQSERENLWRPPSSPARGVRNNPFWLRDYQLNREAKLMTSSPSKSPNGQKKMEADEKKMIAFEDSSEPPEPEAVADSASMESCQDKRDQLHKQEEDDERVTSTIIEERVRDISPSAEQKDVGRVQSIMANARLRQEEFARLLAEHEQIVNEINRVETKISNSQQTANAIRQQQASEQQ